MTTSTTRGRGRTAAPAAPAEPKYLADRHYRVQLNRKVEWPAGSGRFLSPGPETELRGAVCEAIDGAIEHAELV